MKKLVAIALFMLSCQIAFSQRFSETALRTKLDSLSNSHEGLNNQLQLNVSGLKLSELVNSVALENNLNISVDPKLNQTISYNFYDANVKDVLVFIYLNFKVEIDFVGSIISIRERQETKVAPVKKRDLNISYNKSNKFLTLDLKNDTLWQVAEELTKRTETNFVIDPNLRNKVVNAYFLNRPMDQVLEMFASSNELEILPKDDYYTITIGNTEIPEELVDNKSKKKGRNFESGFKSGDLIIEKNTVGALDVFARNVELGFLIQSAAEESGAHYILYSDLKGKTNVDVKDIRFDELVQQLFEGTTYSMRLNDGIYVIGENASDGFRISELVRLENRTIESVKKAIPKEMTSEIEILEFEELNGLILTGGQWKVTQLKKFIRTIDIVVPMVQIDVMLLYSEKSSGTKTGIRAGIKSEATKTEGSIFPALDMNLGGGTINNILSAINGFGVVNLGQVTENFYLSISALEDNGIIDIESTPKISTLNGHEASISIGELTHYQQTTVNVQTSVTNQGVVQSEQWTPIDANLAVTIKPFVSADEHVTLTITVQQNEFAGKQSPTAPPDMDTRTFESMIRVRNGEMILLGGLEKKLRSDSGSGVPLLSRIPVLKWIFSSRKKERSKSKLHILIRPTVTY